MADKRITELDPVTSILPEDVLPFVSVTEDSGLGITKKIRMDQIVPDGGGAGQVLQKASSSNFDLAWANVPSPQYAMLSYRRATTADAPVVAANTDWAIPFDVYTTDSNEASDRNGISGLTISPAGTINFSSGLYSIDLDANARITTDGWGDVELRIVKGGVPIIAMISVACFYAGVFVSLSSSRMLNIVTPAAFQFAVRGSKQFQAGILAHSTTLADRALATLMIKRIDDAIV